MSLSLDQVRKVAQLARLELSEDDLARMQRELSTILDYVDLLQKLNTDGVEPLAHPLPVHNVFRPDQPAPSLPVDEDDVRRVVPVIFLPTPPRYLALPR